MIGVESSDQQQSKMRPPVTDQKEALPSKNLKWTEQHSVQTAVRTTKQCTETPKRV